jgi:hypothetical protein
LRRAGLSYRLIGQRLSLSHTQARRLVEAAFAEAAESTRENARAALGEELDRVDGLIRAASAILHGADSTATEKLHAVSEILRCQETKVRWLGLAKPERFLVDRPTRAEVTWMEVQSLSEEQLDAEARSLGWVPAAEVGPPPDQPAG